jgi:hypothetical protein
MTMTRPLTSTENIQVIDPQQLTRSSASSAGPLRSSGSATRRCAPCGKPSTNTYYERQQMREDNSPLTVAFDEPVLRSAGLKDDTFGEAARFFNLSDWELHNVLCYCHFGATVSAREVATRVRAMQQQVASSTRTLAQKYLLGIGALTCGIGLALLLVGVTRVDSNGNLGGDGGPCPPHPPARGSSGT